MNREIRLSMKSTLLFVLVCWGNFCLSSAQSGYFSNPSFEGPTGQGNIPIGWTTCNPGSTPDTQPFDAQLSPTNGLSYIGLVMRGSDVSNSPKNEDVVTQLLKPLWKDSTYILAIDLAIAPYETDYSPSGTIYYNNSPRFRISGGNVFCGVSEILSVSELITNTTWKRYYFVITPKLDSYIYLKLEIYLDTLKGAYLLLDNMKIERNYIRGKDVVCLGQKRVGYTIFPPTNCLSDFQWSYSGTGATINANADSITVDFATNATNGNLITSFNNCGKGRDTLLLPISVAPLPSGIANIIGAANVCSGQNNVIYYTRPLTSVTNYVWGYSGAGSSITGNTDSITINFSNTATSGNLTVAGINACGTGPLSPLFPIVVNHVPGVGEIIGQPKVCKNQNSVKYYTLPVPDAKSYLWNYSGTGATITGNADSVLINFSVSSTDGYLTVTAQNTCGLGNASSKFPITVNSVPANAEAITGQSEVCVNQGKVKYAISPVNNASSYTWNYSGAGAAISGSGDSIEIDFSDIATNGNLTVKGNNQCGSGISSPKFSIQVGPLPAEAGDIVGPNEVCSSQKNVPYHTPPIKNASNYIWNYSGTGTTIIGTSDSIVINFPHGVSNGKLTVAGNNRCGTGTFSPAFSIVIDTCYLGPPDLNIPNCFSPNGDGINDYFVIRGLIENARFIIFDKYGKILFESTNYQNDWDGRDRDGKYLPTNTYWYVLTIQGFSKEWKGFIYLKR